MVNKKLFWGLMLIWSIILLSFIAIKQYTLSQGTEVLLKTVPVDPRDLFRGDYVILQYDINTIKLDSIEHDYEPYLSGDKVYLQLNNSNKYAKGIKLAHEPFTDEVYLKGKIIKQNNRVLTIKYGIESYFVPQGEGKEIENNIEKIDVVVMIDSYGNAVLKSLNKMK